jgi:hypothetical protein
VTIGGSVAALLVSAALGVGALGAGSLGAGGAPIVACDSDGFGLSYAISGASVTAVTVAGIADPACEGGRLSLTLTGGGTALAAGGPEAIPTDADAADDAVTVQVSPHPVADQIDGLHLVIEGP